MLAAGSAGADPLSLANFGGLRGDPTFEGAFSLYWNPAALAQPGWDVGLDVETIARQASYDRDPITNGVPDAEVAANSGMATISTVGAVPSVMGHWGRSLRAFDVGVGGGVFVENGGTANWDKNLRAPPQYPGAVDGPQRWAAISAQLLLVNLGVGIGARHRKSGLSIGFAPMLVVGSFSTVRARNIDQSEDLVDANGNPKEGRAWFDGRGVGFSAVAGVRWDGRGGWAVGATYERGARVDLEGDLRVAFGTQTPSRERASLTLPIADTVRVSAALRPTRWLTLRPTFEWVLWSALKEHVFRAAGDGTPLFTIPRDFHDLVAGRVRAEAQVSPRWRVLLGVGAERGPTPSRTMEPGFGENSNLDVGAGAIVALSHHVDLSATFVYQYYLPFVVTNSVQQPTTNGTYNDMREILIVDVEVHGWR
ncbi:MAG TPA: outer membrane protein transport protein [Polyangia bacterium]